MPNQLHDTAIDLLSKLISIPSFPGEENDSAQLLYDFFGQHGIKAERYLNNVVVRNKYFSGDKKVILLNSHHDTVKPVAGYTLDPFNAIIKDGRLFGLGSNDAGGALVSLIATFLHLYDRQDVKYDIILAASAEEEISGQNGISSLLHLLPVIDCAVVGEPTEMKMAVAERGLMVVDATARGVSGHAAREEGDNALYKAVYDIDWIRKHSFQKISPLLDVTSMKVTSIETRNKQHNVIPDECSFVIDVRLNELYSHEEVLAILSQNLSSDIKARSTRLRSTSIAMDHPLVKAGLDLNLRYYGSPTISDKALMPFPALKIGPGSSERSHIADEYIFTDEIRNGIDIYISLMQKLCS
ncbi:MAG TPA: M20/M25/M40 family metallo-hydrolase [Ferruginibacter sp.]|nr:M20/M25/M40 family metallo-hydrolase [Ferruginibacter sp.]